MPLDLRGELDKIVQVNDEFQFGFDYSFPCHAETAYRSKQGNLYTLETLIYYVNNHQIKHTDYIQCAHTQGIPSVTFPDRKPLFDYLTVKISSSNSIEFILSPQNDAIHHPKIPTALDFASNDNHINNDNDDYAALDSRILTQIETPVDYMSLIYSNERPLKDREGLLECKGRNFYAVLTLVTKKEEERQLIESQQRKYGLVAKSRLMGSDERGLTRFGDESGYDPNTKPKLHLKRGKVGEMVPIILVPSAFQTLVTIYNVKEFLEDGVYIPTDVKVKQMNGEDGLRVNGCGPNCSGKTKKTGAGWDLGWVVLVLSLEQGGIWVGWFWF